MDPAVKFVIAVTCAIIQDSVPELQCRKLFIIIKMFVPVHFRNVYRIPIDEVGV